MKHWSEPIIKYLALFPAITFAPYSRLEPGGGNEEKLERGPHKKGHILNSEIICLHLYFFILKSSPFNNLKSIEKESIDALLLRSSTLALGFVEE